MNRNTLSETASPKWLDERGPRNRLKSTLTAAAVATFNTASIVLIISPTLRDEVIDTIEWATECEIETFGQSNGHMQLSDSPNVVE